MSTFNNSLRTPRFKPNQQISARHLNRLVEQVEAVRKAPVMFPTITRNVSHAPFEPENPKTLYTEVGGAPTFDNETAQTQTWDYDTDSETYDGYKYLTQTRTAYNEAGDKKIYAFYRVVTCDKYGRTWSISAETRVEVDAAASCT